MRKRVMVICLDAFDAGLADKLIDAGKLPGLARLKAESARFELEHGPGNKARYTGLTWEHFSSGRAPESSGKWSVISFDPKSYRVRQSFATERPFLADVDAKTVVFDVPYFDLQAMPNAVGAVGWGGHDLGVHPQAMPRDLMAEIVDRFGAPPDVDALNVMVYPSVELTAEMGDNLRASVKQRADIAEWLFAERVADWDVALLGFGETHDAVELLYHGIDPDHHQAMAPSAVAARKGLIGVYEEVSAQIERLMNRFPDVALVAFTMHGMGDNDTDLPTMLLLPELLYRMSFGKELFRSRDDWRAARSPALQEGEDWNEAVTGAMEHARGKPATNLRQRALRRARRGAARVAKATLGQAWLREISSRRGPRDKSFDVDWMPASQYARYWPAMDAFAVPSFFEGRVRVNLQGREKDGRVPLERYGATLDAIEAVLRACVDIKTGLPVAREISRPRVNDPLSLGDTQGDLAILWNGSPIGFRHPVLGDIGPAPSRRMGGHSGGNGALYIRSRGVMPGERGLRSSFDVAPTILDLMGRPCARPMDGVSVFHGVAGRPSLAAAEISLPRPVADEGPMPIAMPGSLEVELTIPPPPARAPLPGTRAEPAAAAPAEAPASI
ncbi:MAG: hypothetical protein ACK4NA_13955, partial [Alphaproteobacteria bacterium]